MDADNPQALLIEAMMDHGVLVDRAFHLPNCFAMRYDSPDVELEYVLASWPSVTIAPSARVLTDYAMENDPAEFLHAAVWQNGYTGTLWVFTLSAPQGTGSRTLLAYQPDHAPASVVMQEAVECSKRMYSTADIPVAAEPG